MSNILGISAYFHDSACCLLKDGVLIAAAQEERFSRIKHDPSFPRAAALYCLSEGKLNISDIDCIAYYEDPYKKLERQIYTMLPNLSDEAVFWIWRSAKRPMREIREILGYEGLIKVVDHHQAHAASSFFYSGFPEAAILTVDGTGEWATTTYGYAQDKEINIFEEVHFPNSIGLLYAAITSYLGFLVNDGEYKVMGLAPYGKPVYADQIRQLLSLQHGGQYLLNLDYLISQVWIECLQIPYQSCWGNRSVRPMTKYRLFIWILQKACRLCWRRFYSQKLIISMIEQIVRICVWPAALRSIVSPTATY